jgi:ribosomal protein L37AE/L43A
MPEPTFVVSSLYKARITLYSKTATAETTGDVDVVLHNDKCEYCNTVLAFCKIEKIWHCKRCHWSPDLP